MPTKERSSGRRRVPASKRGVPPIRVLFRYRDLVQPTLRRHQEVLKRKKAVWWGWWKRPTEDARSDVWTYLTAELARAESKAVRVGLFDSGLGTVTAAWITEVRPPHESPDVGLDPVKLGAKELALVPEYYRKSPSSRAWMRIEEFEATPLEFFGCYSYDGLPPHLNYAQATLDHLTDKVILDASELRGMDSTIWRVRGAEEGDRRESFFTTRQVIEPITETPIRTKGDTILHITDPHFAMDGHRAQHVWRLESEQAKRDTLAEALARAVDKRKIAFVVVTGDLTFVGTEPEFEEARRFLVRLQAQLDLASDQIIVVPGNHDIRWSKAEGDVYQPGGSVDVAPDEATANYRQFYKRFFGHVPNSRLTMARRFVLLHGGVVDVCALNSSTLETGRSYLAGMGRVDGGSFDEVSKKFGWESTTHSLALRVLALHHHLAPTEDAENAEKYYTGFGAAIDAPRIQRMAARSGVHVALHGHKHRAFLWRSDVYELPEATQDRWELGSLALLGGGSAGSKEAEGNSNYFNLVRFDASALTVEIFRSKNVQPFAAMSKWTAPVTLVAGRLKLGAWIGSENK